MQKVWIFGDSYAEMTGSEFSWPCRLEKKYSVTNYARGGTGPLWSMNILQELLHMYTVDQLKDINLIFYVSQMSRPNFSFLQQPRDSVFMTEIVLGNTSNQWDNKNFKKYYKKKIDFIKNFFQYYYFYNEKGIYLNYISYFTLLKELSKNFKKVLAVPIFDKVNNRYISIDNTEKFTIADDPIFRHDLKTIDKFKPNHFREENHDIIYKMTVDWIEHNIPFDAKKLNKIS